MTPKTTPMMQQWESCKKEAKDALLFFRMGDFYEAFYEDASILSQELDLTLTKRQEIPMSGVPFHAAEAYIDKLVAKGYRVAIAEQIDDPKQTKGLLQRKIVRTVTPGTLINSSLLPEKGHNYIAALTQSGSTQSSSIGMALLDLTTGAFKVCEFQKPSLLENELARLKPSEILLSKKFYEKYQNLFHRNGDAMKTWHEEHFFEHERCLNILLKHFQVSHLDGFGLKGNIVSINAAGALLAYLQSELNLNLEHIKSLSPYGSENCLYIDAASERHLEIFEPLFEKKTNNSLLNLIDQTETPMGGRRLREWLKAPLLSCQEIGKRQDAIEHLYYAKKETLYLSSLLKEVRDIERLMMRISSNLASPKDFCGLWISLEKISPIKEMLARWTIPLMVEITTCLADVSSLVHFLKNTLVEDPPIRIGDSPLFKEGYDRALDELRLKKKHGKEWLADYQTKLKNETGIRTLKIGYNRIFGYYLEVSTGQAKQMPETFQRKQTLANCERFTTPELKEYEHDLLTAEERILAIENALFEKMRMHVCTYTSDIFRIAQGISILDALLSLAKVASEHHFVRPLVDNSEVLEISEGRHPIIENSVAHGQFIPNDTFLDGKQHLMLISGPNMAGKSTFIRQTALIVILAQMGSFVPAQKARIGVIDKIFTRIGASDDLSRGQSTFMVEMSETANILNNATHKSLVILDEVGRGTSTYDGVSIAWAVVEHLATMKKSKTLFATHYLELTHLEKKIPGIVNYQALVEENKDGIVFLHKIVPGIAPRSYGIHVARLAGLPSSVVVRAQSILSRLEKAKEQKEDKKETEQLLLFS